jgi:hypothetical protein
MRRFIGVTSLAVLVLGIFILSGAVAIAGQPLDGEVIPGDPGSIIHLAPGKTPELELWKPHFGHFDTVESTSS